MSQHNERMRLPVKLNDYTWPGFLKKFIGSNLRKDPRLLVPGFAKAPSDSATTQAISSFKFGSTFKTTQDNRHRQSDQLILDRCTPETVILDIGASDGITSVNLMQKLGPRFAQYFVTDYNLYAYVQMQGKTAFFYDHEGHCILIVNNRFLYYPQESERLRNRFQSRLQVDPATLPQLQELRLVHPKLTGLAEQDKRIHIQAFSVFDTWTETRPSLIKVANVLNPQYFSSEQIRSALENLHQLLPENGLLLIIENRKEEQTALLEKREDGFEWIDRVGPQIDIYKEVASISAMR